MAMDIKLLISPLTHGAYFAEFRAVAEAELRACLPGRTVAAERRGALDFLCVEAEEAELAPLARLSFVQGIFAARRDGLVVIEKDPEFELPEELVWGLKYQGKTHELVTQLALNVGLLHVHAGKGEAIQLLDPLAGRGTTLLWALRYGINARGLEVNGGALESLQQHLRKQAKLHRIKHELTTGFVGKSNRKGIGRYCQVQMAGHTLRLITGDSRDAGRWLQNRKFHLVIADLPYGIQHLGEGDQRDPTSLIEACAPSWIEHLRVGGAMVLIFNEYQPGREKLRGIFEGLGLTPQPFAAPHRMSESIVRDLLLLTRDVKR